MIIALASRRFIYQEETVWVEKRISPLRCSQKREQLRSKGQLFGGAEEEQTTATALRLVERLLNPQRNQTAMKEHRAEIR
jgi:hypothetical protein